EAVVRAVVARRPVAVEAAPVEVVVAPLAEQARLALRAPHAVDAHPVGRAPQLAQAHVERALAVAVGPVEDALGARPEVALDALVRVDAVQPVRAVLPRRADQPL